MAKLSKKMYYELKDKHDEYKKFIADPNGVIEKHGLRHDLNTYTLYEVARTDSTVARTVLRAKAKAKLDTANYTKAIFAAVMTLVATIITVTAFALGAILFEGVADFNNAHVLFMVILTVIAAFGVFVLYRLYQAHSIRAEYQLILEICNELEKEHEMAKNKMQIDSIEKEESDKKSVASS